ncbi:C39 family peptidase [Lachnospiraceae bacterium OttesenSCG-928-D06]|nr:C39 family peptidase [Lachnospiraceae bacterium OttesenSCG-928-D06]
MAIDPATAKLIAQITIKAVTDEDARRKILVVILAPIIGLLLLIAFILYLITSPFSLISSWLLPGEMDIVSGFQKDYGYNQNIGIYDNDYIAGSGQSYEGIVFTDGSTEVIYYSQFDERWADSMYGTSGTIGEAGCGPTSMAMVLSTLLGNAHDPVELAQWSVTNGYRCEGNGSYHSLIPESAKAYGRNVEGAGKEEGQKIVDALSAGKLVVVIMAKGHFTSSGHFIVLRGVTSEGKILVADPASYNRSNQEWDLSIILDEAREGAGAGGPFWIIW